MDLTPIVCDFENTPIRNIASSVLSCIGYDRFFQKVAGLKIHQRYCKETKWWEGKPADDIESPFTNENHSTTKTANACKWGDKLKTKSLKVISSSYMRTFYI